MFETSYATNSFSDSGSFRLKPPLSQILALRNADEV